MNFFPNELWIEILNRVMTTQPIKPAIRDLLSVCSISSYFNVLSNQLIRKYFFKYKDQSDSVLRKFLDKPSLTIDQSTLSKTTLLKLSNLKKLKLQDRNYGLTSFPLKNLEELTLDCAENFISPFLLPKLVSLGLL